MHVRLPVKWTFARPYQCLTERIYFLVGGVTPEMLCSCCEGVFPQGLSSVASSGAVARVWSGLFTPGAVAGGGRRFAVRLAPGLQFAPGLGALGLASTFYGGRKVPCNDLNFCRPTNPQRLYLQLAAPGTD